jgi:His/Glu/Gln/Arg/opine family amino acid ABC transporter permease subunit
MSFDTRVVLQHMPELWEGLRVAVVLILVSAAIGTAIGFVACLGRVIGRGPLYWIATGYINVFRTIPETVIVFWVYYCAPLVLDARLAPFPAGVLSIAIYSGAFLAEIFRAGIEAVPRGHVEAARALGLPGFWVWMSVILPQAVRIMIPAFIGFATVIVKISGLTSAIGVGELVYQASVISGQNYRYFEFFTVIGVIYFAMIFPLSLLAQGLEQRLIRRMR